MPCITARNAIATRSDPRLFVHNLLNATRGCRGHSPAYAASTCVRQFQASLKARIKDVCILRTKTIITAVARLSGLMLDDARPIYNLPTFGTCTATEEPSAPMKVTVALPVAATCFRSFTMSLQKASAAYTRVVDALLPLICVGHCCRCGHLCRALLGNCSASMAAAHYEPGCQTQ